MGLPLFHALLPPPAPKCRYTIIFSNLFTIIKKIFFGSTFQNDKPLPKFGPLIFWKELECELPVLPSPNLNFKKIYIYIYIYKKPRGEALEWNWRGWQPGYAVSKRDAFWLATDSTGFQELGRLQGQSVTILPRGKSSRRKKEVWLCPIG